MMLEVPFKITSSYSAQHISPYVSFSAPIPKGSVFNTEKLAIKKTKTEFIKADFTILARWPDQSIKWLKCEFFNSKSRVNTLYIVELTDDQKHTSIPKRIDIEDSDSLTVKTATNTFVLNKFELGIQTLPCALLLTDQNQNPLAEKINNISYCPSDNYTSKQVRIEGTFTDNNQQIAAEYDANLTFYSSLAAIKLELTLRNPKAVVHHGGKWDLGNENSLLLTHFGLNFNTNNQPALLALGKDEPKHTFENNFTLYQAASGGENWQSKTHVNASNKVNLPFNGYELKSQQEVIQGKRCCPTLSFENQTGSTISVFVKDFWQNFPKAIEKHEHSVCISLFPKQHPELHELLPGEQKTHTIWINQDNTEYQKNVVEDTSVEISPEYIAKTNTIPFFAETKDKDELDALIELGLTHQNNFFAKREQIDEFGWRNFGDLYADHETLEYQGEQELVSHYNNQYDPLYGFLRQYLYSHDKQWQELADSLCSHIKDIDIYHTTEDKPEYNHGLFWHTDHYLPAETAGHRTYSKFQQANAYEDHAGGGGPGGQHCYTTGLMLHYFLTGSESSKNTVVNLASWISHVYECGNTFFDTLLGVKNSQIAGYKNIVTGQYPLDRGTGNYITALIDAYEVTGKQSYLDQASLIIKNTASPYEDLTYRNLENVEETWFYTVFLQAICRYLWTKESIDQIDESYTFAKATLINFAIWMSEHEKPYLDTPEILEYPNHTWAAQDIRKANVLYLASQYTTGSAQKKAFIAKAEEIYQYVGDSLTKEKTHYFTRILCILMQNHGIKNYIANTKKKSFKTNSQATSNLHLRPSKQAMTKRKIVGVLAKSMLSSSITKELNWLRKRIKKVDNIMSKFER